MTSIYDAMKRFLEDANLPGEELIEQAAIRLPFTGSSGTWLCVARAREHQQQFAFYSIAPLEIQRDLRPVAADFFHRVNFGMIFGNFEFDMDDGEVRFKTCIDCQDTVLTGELMKPVVLGNLATMNKYLPAIHALTKGMAARAAVEMAEGPPG